MSFKIQKAFLNGLAHWLSVQSLSGRASRERTRFVALLIEGVRQLERDRNEIVGRYVNKSSEEGGKETWLKTVDNGQERWDIPEGKIEDFNKEVADLYQEDFILDIGEEHRAKIDAIRDILLNTDYKFGPAEGDDPLESTRKIREANDYEEWCKAFEATETSA